jgi:hypothetical protein
MANIQNNVKEDTMENTYTNVATEIQGLAPVWQCDDCGAYADKTDNIVHHPT